MGRKPLGTRPLTNAEKKARQRKQAAVRLAGYTAALQEIVRLGLQTDLAMPERVSAMLAAAERALSGSK